MSTKNAYYKQKALEKGCLKPKSSDFNFMIFTQQLNLHVARLNESLFFCGF